MKDFFSNWCFGVFIIDFELVNSDMVYNFKRTIVNHDFKLIFFIFILGGRRLFQLM